MKKFLSALGLVTSLGFAGSSHASTALTCGFTFDVHGGGVQVGVGYYKLTGTGTFDCFDVHGNKSSRAAIVTMGGHPLAARVAAGYFHMKGASPSFGFNGSIDDLYGHYLVTEAHGAVVLGGGATLALQNPANGLRVSLGLTGSLGIGVDVGLSVVTFDHPTAPDHCHHHHPHQQQDQSQQQQGGQQQGGQHQGHHHHAVDADLEVEL